MMVSIDSSTLIVQDSDINKVSDTVIGTTENIKDGNDEIREVCLSLVTDVVLEAAALLQAVFCMSRSWL